MQVSLSKTWRPRKGAKVNDGGVKDPSHPSFLSSWDIQHLPSSLWAPGSQAFKLLDVTWHPTHPLHLLSWVAAPAFLSMLLGWIFFLKLESLQQAALFMKERLPLKEEGLVFSV